MPSRHNATRHHATVLVAGLLAGCAAAPGSSALPDPPVVSPVAAAPSCEQLPSASSRTPESGALPPLTLPCLGPGPQVSLADLTGRPTVVNLWATWCVPCREQMPLLQQAHARSGDRLRFLGVDTKDDPRVAAALVAELGVSYPQVVDRDGELLRGLGVPGLPVTVGLDEHGRMVSRLVGQLNTQKLQQLTDTLLERPPDGGRPAGG